MVAIDVLRVEGLGDWWPNPKPAREHFPNWIKNLKKTKQSTGELNIADCMPAIESMLHGLIIEFPVDITFENLGFNKNIGKLISCSHIGYPVIEGHHDSQYTEAEFQNYHVVKIGLPWIFSVPDGFSCLFTPPFNRQGSEDYFCLSGTVRSDLYYNMVNIPIALKLKNKGDRITLNKGKPFVQILPFQRTPVQVNYGLADKNKLKTSIENINKNEKQYLNELKNWR